MSEKTYTKESLINELRKIKSRGWIEIIRNDRNAGNIGNTLEDLLEIKENNLPIPNATEWELKTQRINTNALVTLFHMEPSPNALNIVSYLLKNFGWKHEKAGKKYPDTEKSFRQTLSYQSRTARGFAISIDDDNKKIIIDFDIDSISPHLSEWRDNLINNGRIEIDKNYVPYWGFDDVYHKAGIKLKNCFFIQADEKKEGDKRLVKYENIIMLSSFRIEKMIKAIKNRQIYIDFDARTGHNHGTKFRIKPGAFHLLYENIKIF